MKKLFCFLLAAVLLISCVSFALAVNVSAYYNDGKVVVNGSDEGHYTIYLDNKGTGAWVGKGQKTAIIEKLGSKKYTLQRSKGLGENQPEMMKKTTMDPATRRLIKITTADAAETARMFEMLLGDDIESRKTFIAENAERYMELADI